MTFGPDYEHERLMKYARELGVSDDPVAMAYWKPLIERVMRVADSEIVNTLSEHASAHNRHLESTRRELQRMEECGRKAVLDHNCSFFSECVAEHRMPAEEESTSSS